MSLKIKNSKGEWVVDQKAIQTSIIDLEGNFESKNVEGALRELASKKSRSTDELEGFVQCEKLALLDLTIRGYKKISTLKLTDRINIVDAVQGIFDYV